jgi:hypothetical protein
MKKILMIADNPFQTMVAMIMKDRMFPHVETDLFLTNRSSGTEERFAKLQEIQLFHKVYLGDVKKCWDFHHPLQHHAMQARCALTGCFRLKDCQVYHNQYTEIICLYPTLCIGSDLILSRRRSRSVKISIFDEGFGVYTNMYLRTLLAHRKLREKFQLIRSRGKVASIWKSVDRIYLFNPNLLQWKAPFQKIEIKLPEVEHNPKLKDMLNHVFQYENVEKEYQYPYIFFENCGYQDYGLNDDLVLVKQIAAQVGKENLLVKLHPRTKHNRFQELGIPTNQGQSIPWEIIAMNMQGKDPRTFITVSSSALISYQMLFPEKKFRSIFLHNMVRDQFTGFDDSVRQYFEQFAEKNKGYVFVPETEAALQELLE